MANGLGIFILVQDFWAVAKLEYIASISCKYTASQRLVNRFLLELESLLIII